MWSIIVMVFVVSNGEMMVESRLGIDQYVSYAQCNDALRDLVRRNGEPASNEVIACVRSGPEREA